MQEAVRHVAQPISPDAAALATDPIACGWLHTGGFDKDDAGSFCLLIWKDDKSLI
jgi:hypothetical protein